MRWHTAVSFSLMFIACLPGFWVAKTPADNPPFRPDEFFAGSTHGVGVLSVRGKRDRPFHVTGFGKPAADGTFILDQTITYADGGKDTRSFRIRRANEHDYVGTLTGITGPVRARAEGNSFHIQYTIRKPAVTIEQWIYLQRDRRTALNRATVRVLGIPVAHLSETITRTDR
ncbi:MAG: DUF3833 family protein [Gemmatimonadaceae bacterium]